MRLAISGEWAQKLGALLVQAEWDDRVLIVLHRSGERERFAVEFISADGGVIRKVIPEPEPRE